MKVLKGLILAAVVTLLVGNVYAQEGHATDAADLSKDTPAEDSQQLISANYAFSIQAGIPLEDMSVNTTDLIAGGTDNNNSIVVPIGFLYRFEGVTVSSFSANGNGIIRLSSTPITGSNNTNQIASSANSPRVMPYWDDLCVGNGGKVHFKRVGSIGNRKLVVEWKNMQVPRGAACDGGGTGTFQLWIFEHTGVIQFVYGNGMLGTSSNGGYSVGLGNSGNFASITTAFGSVDYMTANDAQTNPISAGTSYLFTPSIVAAPTGGNVTQLGQTSLQLNWTDNANNEVGYYIRRSLTGSELEYVPIATLPANSTSFSDSGLEPGRQHFYLINAISDSAVSQDLLLQPTTLPPNNAPSTATGGLWSSPSTWANGAVPLSQDNVTIAPGATVIIDTAAVAGNVTVGTGGSLAEGEKSAEGGAPAVLQFGEAGAFSLTVARNVTIGSNDTFSTGGGNGNQHVLSVGGDLINNGTLDFSTNGNTAGAGIVFTGASNNTFGGAGAVTDIRTLTIDKGTTNANILDLTVSNFTVQGTTSDGPASGYLFLNKGTFKISGTFAGSHRTFASPTYQIVAAAGFWLNNPNYTVAGQSDTAVVLGSLRVSAGTYNVGTAAGNSLQIADFGKVTIEGGAINVTGRFGAYNNVHPLSYTQTGGTLTTCKIGHTSTTLACFDLGANRTVNTSVVMTGGDIVIEKHPPVAGAVDYRNEAGFAGPDGLAGTTVHFGSPLSGGPHTFTSLGWLPNVHIDSSVGLHNLTFLSSSQGNTAHDMFIPPGSTVNIGNAPFTVRGHVLVNNGTIIAQGATANFIFGRGLGSNPIYSGSGSFAGLTEKIRVFCNTLVFDPAIVSNIRVRNIEVYQGNIINANKLTLGNNDAIVSSISFGLLNTLPPTGTFDTAPIFELGTGSQSLSYLGTAAGTARTIGPELNPARTLFNLVDDDAGTLTFTGGDITVNNTLTLARGQVVTGPNKVVLNGGVSHGSGYVAGTLKWRLTQLFFVYVFPVGRNGYTPVIVEPSGGIGGHVTITPVDETLPGLLPATAASRYFTVLTEGPAFTGRMTFTYTDGDISGGNKSDYKLWRSNGGAPVLIPGSTVTPGSNRIGTPGGYSEFTGNWGIGTELNTAPVSISGSVTQAGGQPIANATLTISGGNLPAPVITQTGSFGLYQFTNLQAGETYTVRVDVKRFRFSVNTQQVTPTTDVTNINFVANPQ